MAQVRVQPVCPCPHPWPSSEGFREVSQWPQIQQGAQTGAPRNVCVRDPACACHVCMCLSTFVTQSCCRCCRTVMP